PPPPRSHPRPLHDALPISPDDRNAADARSSTLPTGALDPGIHLFSDDPKPPTRIGPLPRAILIAGGAFIACMLAQLVSMQQPQADRKSTRLNSSHVKISYA